MSLRFEYHAPVSVPELADLLARWGGRARILAGGQTLLPLLNGGRAHTEHLIDINGVEGLGFIDCQHGVAVGAGCPQKQLETFPKIAERHPLLAEALPWIGDRAVRARGTVCGSLAAAHPAAELRAVALTTEATLHIQSKRGARHLLAGEFYVAGGGTVLEPDEVVSSVSFPAWQPEWGGAIEELRYTAMSFAVAGAVVMLGGESDSEVRARITVFGLGIPAQRMTGAEVLLKSEPMSRLLLEQVAGSVRNQTRADDVPGVPAPYAVHVAGTLVRRAVGRAAARAGLQPEEVRKHYAIQSH